MLPRSVLFLVLSATASGQGSVPRFTPVRYDEDYSYLEGGEPRTSWWEGLKRVPIGHGTDWTWTLGAELRARYESYWNDAFDAGSDADHDYFWYRALPCLEIRHSGGFRAFGQLISAFEEGDEAGVSPVDEDRADFLQLFLDVPLDQGRGGTRWTLRGGRQTLALGSERLISARYGPNVLRSFDAANLIADTDTWNVQAILGRPVRNELGEFDDEADDSRSLWSLYGTRRIGEQQGIDLYYIGFVNENATFDQGSGREERHTLGSRIFGHGASWDWNFELMAQAGHFGNGDIRAWSIASDTGFVLGGVPFEPRLGLKANIISGDDDPSEERLQTFDPLFPKGKYFGEAGVLGPYNLVNLHPSLTLALSSRTSLAFASVLYWRESTGDGVYDTAGQLLRSGTGSEDRFIGSQYDVVLDYAANRCLDMSLAYSAFVPGGFVESTGSSETVHFVGIELRFRF